MFFLIRKLVLLILFIALLVGLIALARGYRFSPTQREIKSTGIIVASSTPDGAKVFINGELRDATNSNIIVPPGDYTVEITKDGYTSWSKDLKVKGELVLKADARLFPQNPTLSPVTTLGVNNAFVSPSGDKIIILSDAGNEEKDGVYMLENVRNPLSRINPLNLLVLKETFSNEGEDFSLANISVEFSPDEEQVLLTTYNVEPVDEDITETGIMSLPEDAEINNIYLVDADGITSQLFNVTASVDTIREAWTREEVELTEKTLKAFKKPLAQVAVDSFDIMAFSPDETKILYTASQSATLPIVIEPPLVATNQTPEERSIEPGNVYVYDAEEDKNFLLFTDEDFATLETARERVMWYSSSAHIVKVEDNRISILDYDGTNERTVYSGPFEPEFIATSKDGRLFILTNFNTETGSLLDIYSVGLN